MSTKMLPSAIPVNSRALYLAINARDGYAAENDLPLVAREKSKILYLENEHGLICKKTSANSETDFLAAYSGEILTTRQLLTHNDPRTHAYTISLAHEQDEEDEETELPIRYLSRRWLFSGWNALGKRDLAIFANHQIVNNEKKWSFLDLYKKFYPNPNPDNNNNEPNNEHQKLVKNGAKGNENALKGFAELLGTHELLFWRNGTVLTFDKMLIKSKDNIIYRDYLVQVKYPANAQLARMLLDRTFILSTNSVDKDAIDILGGGAERNRLVHWRGAMCCRVTYIEKLPDAVIYEGDEIIVTYGAEYQEYNSGDDKAFSEKRTTAYYPANRPFLKLFQSDDASTNEHLFIRALKIANNTALAKLIRDLIPLVMLLDNIKNESSELIGQAIDRYTTAYAGDYIRTPEYDDSALFVRKLVSETLVLLLGDEYETLIDKNESIVALLVDILNQRLAEFLQADEMDRIAQSLYKASVIHFVPKKESFDKVQVILRRFRKEREQRSRELCFGERLTELESIDDARMLSDYYEIPLLGVTNLFYRDALYYMTTNDVTLFAESLSGYNTSMRIYTASRAAFAELIAPVTHYVASIFNGQVDLERLARNALEEVECANTLNGLKMLFIYRIEQFDTSRREMDYLSLAVLYMRLFGMIRLLPLTQLEDAWLDRLYRQFRALFVYVSQQYVLSRDDQTLDRGTPTTSPLWLFSDGNKYHEIKQKWYARVPLSD